jgi:hypothetical protein
LHLDGKADKIRPGFRLDVHAYQTHSLATAKLHAQRTARALHLVYRHGLAPGKGIRQSLTSTIPGGRLKKFSNREIAFGYSILPAKFFRLSAVSSDKSASLHLEQLNIPRQLRLWKTRDSP